MKKIKELQDRLSERSGTWVAEDTPFFNSSIKVKKNTLGLLEDEQEVNMLRKRPKLNMFDLILRYNNLLDKDNNYIFNDEFVRALKKYDPDLTDKFATNPVDWRNRNGGNYVTPQRGFQGPQMCVAWAVTSTLESMLLIERNREMNLSDVEVHTCGGGGLNGNKVTNALQYLYKNGTSTESCFPKEKIEGGFIYNEDGTVLGWESEKFSNWCQPCLHRDSTAIQIRFATILNSFNERIQYLNNIGPVVMCFDCFDSFFAYTSGYYSREPLQASNDIAAFDDPYLGGHCVEVVGYDSMGWICKNSWWPIWGESGFFKIKYGQCGIESKPAYGLGNTQWYDGPPPQGTVGL
jgi:hypothetical protein